MHRIHIDAHDDQRAALTRLAAEQHTTVESIVSHAVDAYLFPDRTRADPWHERLDRVVESIRVDTPPTSPSPCSGARDIMISEGGTCHENHLQ